MKCPHCNNGTKTLYVRDGIHQERRIAVIKHCYNCKKRVAYETLVFDQIND